MNPLRGEGKGLEVVSNKHTRGVECCDLRCTHGSTRLVKSRERFVRDQECGFGDQRRRYRRLRPLPSAQALNVSLNRIIREPNGGSCGTYFCADERCGYSATL